MSLRKTINLLPVEFNYTNNSIEAIIYYERKYYTGTATCHSDDMDFFSTKVGQTIAHKRAIINALKDIKEKTNIEYNAVKRFYNDILRENKKCEYIIVIKEIVRLKRQINKYLGYIKTEEKELNTYLKAQSKVITSLKRQRKAINN